jgi:ABC-type transport system involved in multi-copper enzyme maturation permease subunit
VTALVAADLLKLRRRRGLWGAAIAIPIVLSVITMMLAATGAIDLDGGDKYMRDVSSTLTLIGTVLAVLIGARMGSMESAAGTLRYQLLTGVPRHRLYLAKVAVVVISCLAIALASTIPTAMGALAVPPGSNSPVGFVDMLAGGWDVLVTTLAYGLISFGVGAMTGSTGPAIAISLVLALIGTDVVAVLTLISDAFRNVVLDVGIDRLTVRALDAEDEISLGAAVAVVIAWPAAFVVAGWLRLRRAEA